MFSASVDDGMNFYYPLSGDIGFAVKGYNVYVVPTNRSILTSFYYLSGKTMKNMSFLSAPKAEKIVKERYRKTIPLKK